MSVLRCTSQGTGGRRLATPAGRLATAALLTVALVSACGGGGSDGGGATKAGNAAAEPGPAATAGNEDFDLPTLTVTFDIEGQEPLKGDVEGVPATRPGGGGLPDSCADYAKGGASSSGKPKFQLPLEVPGKLGAKNVVLAVSVKDYAGPGTYTDDQLSGQGAWIQVDDRAYARSAAGEDGVVVTVKADGSGDFVFEKLAIAESGGPSPGISGRVSWTCKNP